MPIDHPIDKHHAHPSPSGPTIRSRRGRKARPIPLPRLAILAIGCVAVSTAGAVSVKMTEQRIPAAAAAATGDDAPLADRTAAAVDRAARDHVRESSAPSAPASPGPSGPAVPSSAPARPKPKPVKGLNQAQMDNAVEIVTAGRKLNLPRRAHVVALATALQESGLRNLANPRVPASLKQTHQGSESNFDSLGLFQQRPSQGWGSAQQLMAPGEASRLFYLRLAKVPGWERMSVTGAAQAVQKSAYPDAYAKHQARAEEICAALA